jgi:hypothetical protein
VPRKSVFLRVNANGRCPLSPRDAPDSVAPGTESVQEARRAG